MYRTKLSAHLLPFIKDTVSNVIASYYSIVYNDSIIKEVLIFETFILSL